MASIELENIHKSFGRVEVVHDVSLSIADRELVVFVGPSGCGKSTLLRMIAGLEDITAGELRIGGKAMNAVPAADRGIAMVFQSYALYPHMSVAENMGFALKMMGIGRAEVEAKVRAAARTLQLEELLERKPGQLSGGQRQRVAIGRAITRSPDVFLFDEPLSNLDADLRAQMRVEIARLRDQLQTTMIYVTHDQVEAMTLADRIVILKDGRIEQEGAPLDLYQKPANRFVAGFLGQPKMNFVPVTAAPEGLRVGSSGPVLLARQMQGVAAGTPFELGIRPDAITVDGAGDGAGGNRDGNGGLPARVVLVERLGGSSLIHVRVEGIDAMLTAELAGVYPGSPGREVRLEIDASRVHVFDKAGRSV